MKRLLPFFMLLCACGTPSQERSELDWAHGPAERSMSVITSRLSYLQLGYRSDFTDIAVCVQNSASFKGPELLLESKLAYAAWLEASGQGSAEAWEHFSFVEQDRCSMDDNAFSSIVVIGSEEEISPDQNVDATFARINASCQRSGLSVSCQTGKMTMGLGGAGAISYRYFRPETWESVSNRVPASLILSPYVKWTSLATELERRPEQKSLLEQYKKLAADAGQVSYADLVAFHKNLQSLQLKSSGDPSFDAFMKAFMDSDAPSARASYVPVRPALHVLLHEVGHQFGMDHADNPNGDSETGTVGDARKVGDKWESELATMAYADDYYYLTADDVAGVRDLATKTHALAKARQAP